MEIIDSFLSFDGVQKIIRHNSDALSCEMTLQYMNQNREELKIRLCFGTYPA